MKLPVPWSCEHVKSEPDNLVQLIRFPFQLRLTSTLRAVSLFSFSSLSLSRSLTALITALLLRCSLYSGSQGWVLNSPPSVSSHPSPHSCLTLSLPLNPNLAITASTTRYLKLFNSSQHLPFILNCLTCFGYPGPTSFRHCAH